MKIVQIPKKLWVDSYEFALRMVPKNDPILDGQDGDMTADTDKECSISIADNLNTRRRFEVVMHEITHAINWTMDITGDMPVEEEDIADKHGRGWSQFYLNNPRFVLWLVYILERIRRDQNEGDDDANAANP